HARTELLRSNHHAATPTRGTLFDGTLFTAPTFALVANDVLLQRQFAHGSVVQFLERYGHLMHNVFATFLASSAERTASHSTAEKHVEYVHWRRSFANTKQQDIMIKIHYTFFFNFHGMLSTFFLFEHAVIKNRRFKKNIRKKAYEKISN